LRYWLGLRVTGAMGSTFPWSTLTVNLIGSFLVGVCMVLIAGKASGAELWRLGLMVGLLGGFTTFSAFSSDTLGLLEAEQWFRAMVYISASILLCITAAAAGVGAARQIF
ncbi:MAG TPA: fluoride efflux transporter CrcB, partial [Gammaproteobacteria bacterium]|nr:fluoride efflux transporter CrcB [Gammaproteobacteria bacterium]